VSHPARDVRDNIFHISQLILPSNSNDGNFGRVHSTFIERIHRSVTIELRNASPQMFHQPWVKGEGQPQRRAAFPFFLLPPLLGLAAGSNCSLCLGSPPTAHHGGLHGADEMWWSVMEMKSFYICLLSRSGSLFRGSQS
jgi:hypothetical protein